MRQIGNLPTAELGQRFQDYLLTRGIQARVDADGDAWAVWIFDEDQLDLGRKELAEFQAMPDDSRFVEAAGTARKIRQQEEKARKQLEKKRVRVRDEFERPTLSKCPVTMTLMLASVAATLLTDFGDARPDDLFQKLTYASYLRIGDKIQWAYLSDIRSGEIWRVFTPMFLHFKIGGGPWHLIFNMMWLYSLGTVIEFARGKSRFLLLVLATAAAGNTAQYFGGGPSFGGMSGVVYGLIGYIWIKSTFDSSLGLYMPQTTMFWAMLFFVACLTGAVGHVANWCHSFGLISGGVIAYVPISLRNLRRKLQ